MLTVCTGGGVPGSRISEYIIPGSFDSWACFLFLNMRTHDGKME